MAPSSLSLSALPGNGYPLPMKKETDAAESATDDVQSDPSKGADDGADWSDEGGATPSGPAADTDAS